MEKCVKTHSIVADVLHKSNSIFTITMKVQLIPPRLGLIF